jgi:hypothetical protein
MTPKRNIVVIPMRQRVPLLNADQLVSDFAYTLWLASAFRGVSPEEALLTAVQVVRGKTSAGLFLVPKCQHNHHSVTGMKSHLRGPQ